MAILTRGWIGFLSLAIIAFINLAKADEPAFFIFGDSTADVGTNNNLKECGARADHRYNGIDYPNSTPTGRFSNGYNSADLIVRQLGDFKISPPPFLSLLKRTRTFKRNILRGVNFASGGSGIFKETGRRRFVSLSLSDKGGPSVTLVEKNNVGKVVSLEKQIQQFATVCGNITEVLGPAEADHLISNSIYIISVGSNDIIEIPFGTATEKFINKIHFTYANHLKNLYKLGARKFGIISVPPIGCCPAVRVYNSSGGCVDPVNAIARAFYKAADALLQHFSSEFKGVKYSLANAYHMTMSIIDNPIANGFKDVKTACCGNGTVACKEGSNLCANRNDYLFWDWFHPTQAASELAALTLAFAEGPEFVKPVNFSQLARVVV
ncbi:hypothetical protein RJ639_005176 [Escallonia herrerae]|uniref:GDSL esterase/lipase n=1 Tax=Escallonia herrerae TaxID=1293975 RepID=A0AA88VYV5_9ASTE|nr:hypothetical protein RJ639_005176 [Escallonia herrerae]